MAIVVRIALIISLCFLTSVSKSQVGGEGVYNFLNLTITPRTAALGGKLVALDESDPGITLMNPSHLNPELHNNLELSYVSYFDDIRYGFVSYSRSYKDIGMVGVGMQHVGYGSFIEADPTGEITGSFTGYDMALVFSFSRPIADSLFSFGINFKPVFSQMERYSSAGISFDAGLSYNNPEGLFAAGLVARNIGTMIKPYNPHTWERLPFELVAGLSQKLRHAPFRFTLTLHQLQSYSLHYKRQDDTRPLGFGEQEPRSETLLERIGNEAMSHLIIGVEFIPVKSFIFRAGYNYQRRHELKIPDYASTVGFSWGFGLRLKRFTLNYSRATYHLVGGSNHFSISSNLQELVSRSNL